jgi:hypothetical protein
MALLSIRSPAIVIVRGALVRSIFEGPVASTVQVVGKSAAVATTAAHVGASATTLGVIV